MRALEFITGHVIYNPVYNCKFQLKTTLDKMDEIKVGVTYIKNGAALEHFPSCEQVNSIFNSFNLPKYYN